MARQFAGLHILNRLRLVRLLELGFHNRGHSLHVAAHLPLVFGQLETHVLARHIGISQTKEELELAAHSPFVVNFVRVAQAQLGIVFGAHAQVGNVVLLAADVLHKLKQRFGQTQIGVGAHIELYRVDAAKSLEAKAEQLIFEVKRKAVLVLQSAKKLTSVHIGVHKGGKGVAVLAVALPVGPHFINKLFQSDVTRCPHAEVAQWQ